MCGKMCGTYGQDDKLLSIFLKGEQEQKTGTQVDRFIVGSPLCYFNEFPSIITTASAPHSTHFPPSFHSVHEQRPVAGGRGQLGTH